MRTNYDKLSQYKEKIEALKNELRALERHELIYESMDLPAPKEFQVEAIDSFSDKGIILMPTGTGKTIVAMHIMKKVCPKVGKAIVLVPTEALLLQWRRFLMKSGLSTGVFYGKCWDTRDRDVVVAIYNSAASHLSVFDDFKFVVCDEVHHLGSKEFQRILGVIYTKPKALGITSVIKRLDGMDAYILSFMPIIYKMNVRRAIEKGWISELKIHPNYGEDQYIVDLTLIERMEYEDLTEKINKFFRYFGYSVNIWTVDHPLARIARGAIQKRKVLLANAFNKKKVVLDLLQRYKDERVIMFSTSIESVQMIRKIIINDPVLNKRTVIYHSQMNSKDKALMLEHFRTGQRNIMLSVKALEEGLDVPEASIGIVIGSDRTPRSFIQKMGRLMRKTEKSWKDIYVVYARDTVESKIVQSMRLLLLR